MCYLFILDTLLARCKNSCITLMFVNISFPVSVGLSAAIVGGVGGLDDVITKLTKMAVIVDGTAVIINCRAIKKNLIKKKHNCN